MHGVRLHKTSQRDTTARDKTYWTETETCCSEMRPETHRSKTETLRILSETRR